MKLMTKEIKKRFAELGSQDGKGMEAEVVVKYFNPTGVGTWLITEGTELEDGDWELFGYCDLGFPEWGYVMLSELERVRLPFGLSIERDLYCAGETVKELMR